MEAPLNIVEKRLGCSSVMLTLQIYGISDHQLEKDQRRHGPGPGQERG